MINVVTPSSAEQATPASPIASPAPVKTDLQYRAVRLIALLVRYDEKWLPQQAQMVRKQEVHFSSM